MVDYTVSQTLDCVDTATLIYELRERVLMSNVADVLTDELEELRDLLISEL